jgi:hypothetical protein
VSVKNAIYWDDVSFGCYKNWHFGGPYLVTLMIEVLCSSETLVLTRVTQRNIPEASILRDISASGVCWWCESTGRWHGYSKQKHRNFNLCYKEVDLEINMEKTTYGGVSSHHLNAGPGHVIRMTNSSFENVSQFKWRETTVANQNLSQEEECHLLGCDAMWLL